MSTCNETSSQKPASRTRRGPQTKNGAISSATKTKPAENACHQPGVWCVHQPIHVGSGWVS